MVDKTSNIPIFNKDKPTQSEGFHIYIEPANEIHLEHEKMEDWDFFWNVERMLSSKELDTIADRVKVNRLPDMFFGYNRFYIVNSKFDFVLEINPLQMIDLGGFEERKNKLINEDKISKEQFDPTKDDPNFIYYEPSDVKVQYYNKWKDMKIEREDVKKMDPTEDWTFTSSYMGSIGKLSEHKLFNTNIDLFSTFDPFQKYKNVDVKPTEDNLPVHKLGQENTIIKYMEINLYDDELCDNGVSMGNFRYF